MRTNMMRHNWGLNLNIGLKQVVIEVGLETLTFDSQNLYSYKNKQFNKSLEYYNLDITVYTDR